MRAFVRAHRKQLDRERTFFIVLDTVGNGDVRFETAAGWVTSYGMDRRLIELCEAIAAADAEDGNRFRAEPLRHGLAGDSMPPRLAGYRSIGITCLDGDGYAPESPPADRHAEGDRLSTRSSAPTTSPWR